MCSRCDYPALLAASNVGATPMRLSVLEVVGATAGPLSAREIFETLRRTSGINRVTVYRILDLLVEKGLLDRIKGGGRSFLYGLAPNPLHPAHPHFYCTSCGALQCLQPGSLKVDLKAIERSFAGEIQGVEVRVDGVCRTCLDQA